MTTQKITVSAFTSSQWETAQDNSRVRPSVHRGTTLNGEPVELSVFNPLSSNELSEHKPRARGWAYFVHPEANVEGMGEIERMDLQVRCLAGLMYFEWPGQLCLFLDKDGNITSCYRLVETNKRDWDLPSWEKLELEVV